MGTPTKVILTTMQRRVTIVFKSKKVKDLGEATMKVGTCAGILGMVLAVLAALCSGCGSASEPAGNQPPVISSLEAKYMNLDPQAASEIRCVASDPDGDEVEFKWSCTGGSLSGAGSAVTWKAPNSYGDYHVMVIVKDTNGGSTQATSTLSVVARPCYIAR